MSYAPHTWAIVLAAGQGKRLSSLTADERGVAVPKQFCSLRGGSSLLRETLCRVAAVAPRQRICTVVAAEHRHWWQRELGDMPRENIIVQPADRGTAHGILLPLLHVERRDPQANILLLPSDHHVHDENTLASALRDALHHVAAQPRRLLMLGIEPDEADPELGYIVPGKLLGKALHSVARFVEKPPLDAAQELVQVGALWNAFIIAAHGHALLRLFALQLPENLAGMRRALRCDRYSPERPAALGEFYLRLQNIDFSQHLLPGAEALLRVLPVPACGWSDLGTPQRLAVTLQRLPRAADPEAELPQAMAGVLNLAAQHAQRGLHVS